MEKNSLNTAMVITNKDAKAFEFELLMHTYLRVKVRFYFMSLHVSPR